MSFGMWPICDVVPRKIFNYCALTQICWQPGGFSHNVAARGQGGFSHNVAANPKLEWFIRMSFGMWCICDVVPIDRKIFNYRALAQIF